MTAIILFKRKGKNYRMRLSRIHQHPGDRDQFEVSSKDMMDQVAWSPVPDGSSAVPSGEWLARRALWHLLNNAPALEYIHNNDVQTVVIDLGELEI